MWPPLAVRSDTNGEEVTAPRRKSPACQAVAQAAAFGAAGADLVIMNLPVRAKPDMLGDLADALRPLA